MKLRYLLSMMAAALMFFTSCEESSKIAPLDNIKLSNTYLVIPVKGGSVELTIDAKESWEFVKDKSAWPEITSKDADGKEVIKPSWLSPASQMSGEAGVTKVTFTAGEADGGRELELSIKVGDNTFQYLRVRQGDLTPVTMTVAEALASPVGKNVKIKGVCTNIQNVEYGNWDLVDNTGKIYIYGTLDAEGKEKNWASLNIEAGDSVEVEGPIGEYKGVPQMAKVTVNRVVKALLKMQDEAVTVPVEGKDGVEVRVAYKGSGVFMTPLGQEYDWIALTDTEYKPGVPSKLERNPADTAIFKFNVQPNLAAGNRVCKIEFMSYKGNGSTLGVCELTQLTSMLFNETFLEGQGEFTVENITLPQELSKLWAHSTYNGDGFMKVSGYYSKDKKSLPAESLLISPEIDLTSVESAVLTFDHALNNLFGGNKAEHIFLCVKKAGDTDWTNIAIPDVDKLAGNSYDFFGSGNIDLAEYKGNKIQIAFRYVSTDKCAPTWEIKNFVIK